MMFNFFTNLPEISLTLRNIFKTEMIGGLLAKGVTVEAATLLEAKSLAKGRVEQQQRDMYPRIHGSLYMVKKSRTDMQSFCCFTEHKRKPNDDGHKCTFRVIFRLKHIDGRVVIDRSGLPSQGGIEGRKQVRATGRNSARNKTKTSGYLSGELRSRSVTIMNTLSL